MVVLGTLASPVFAQAAAENKPPEHVAVWIVIASGFSMAIAAAACEGMARNPSAAGAIRTAMILGLVFIETLALFTLAIVFAKVGY